MIKQYAIYLRKARQTAGALLFCIFSEQKCPKGTLNSNWNGEFILVEEKKRELIEEN